MLGEQLGEERGKISAQRVLPSDGPPKVETSFQASGKLLGVDIIDRVTYHSVLKPDGTLYGEGQGVIMSADGDAVSFTGQGIGRFGPGGSVNFRGALFYANATGKLARLNGVVGVFEFQDEGNGNTNGKIWEWK